MKEIGIIRKIDRMGRIVLPKELRWKYKMDSGDLVEIYVEGDKILLKKFEQKSSVSEQVETLFETMESMQKELEVTKELQDYLEQVRTKLRIRKKNENDSDGGSENV